MNGIVIETVVVALCFGGALGAIIAVHLQHYANHKKAEIRNEQRRFYK